MIRDAMRGKTMVALGRLVLAKRERVITLEPYDKGLLGTTMSRNIIQEFEGSFANAIVHSG